jgi:exonuclease III
MNTNIVSWNVRGLNDGAKRMQVRNLLHSWKADIVCLQETKLPEVSKALIRSLW